MDLRDYLGELKAHGELKETDVSVHWEEEAPALAAMNNRIGGPAVLYNSVSGYSDWRLASNLYSNQGSLYWIPGKKTPWSKVAIALRLDPNIDYESLMEELVARRKQPLRPTKTTGGECKEVKITGEDVNLYSLPLTRQTEEDGGRYGTAGIVVGKDQESDWTSWGVHRFMVASKDTAVLNLSPGSHLANIFAKYESNNQNMPVCIFFGGDPACFIAASTPLPDGMSETEFAGALAQDPIELVQAETSNLLVPGEAEVVIEGELVAGQRMEEGPFPEYVRMSEKALRPVLKVKAITHRKNPILPFVAEGCKVSDSMTVISLGASLELTKMMSEERFFKVRWLNLPVEAKLSILVVATDAPYRGYNYFLTKFLNSKKRRMWFDKIMIVDSDLNAIDLYEVVNDFWQKVDPRRGKGIRIDTFESPLSPVAGWANAQERAEKAGATVYFQCNWPEEWKKEEIPVRVSFENTFPVEIQQRVVGRWKNLELPGVPWVKPVSAEWSRALTMAR
jgi:4-hydroxy-3-polyprenylbenzoate decarboxylase